MGPRYINRLTHDDVGSRVTVRRWITDAERGLIPSDVVGHLDSWDQGILLVRRRNGEVVEVREDDILAARVIPARDARD